MDNLSRDVREAMRLGYGVHYGRYKADYPYTADHSVENPEQKAQIIRCKHCGREFEQMHKNRQYCSDECKELEKEKCRRQRESRPELPTGEAICPVCGGVFIRTSKNVRKQYCSQSCASVIRNKNRKGEKRKKHPIQWETSSDGES